MTESGRLVLPEADTASPLRAIYSLHEKHVKLLTTVLSQSSGRWNFERHECYDGNLILMLTLQCLDAQIFVVSRDQSGFQLSSNQDDKYQSLGCFSTMNEVINTLQAGVITTTKRGKTA